MPHGLRLAGHARNKKADTQAGVIHRLKLFPTAVGLSLSSSNFVRRHQ
jgi:hypothetical protein